MEAQWDQAKNKSVHLQHNPICSNSTSSLWHGLEESMVCPIPDIMSVDQTQAVAQAISKVFDSVWTHHAKAKQACAHSKSWWDTDCAQAKASAMASDLLANQMAFK
jgi:hypothetical protein